MRTCIRFCAALLTLPAATAAAQQPGNLPPDQLSNARNWAGRLASEVEHLQEDIRIDLEGPGARKLYDQADVALREVVHFERVLSRGADRDHLYRDFQEMDQRVHELIDSVSTFGNRGALAGRLDGVRHADQQLHYALSVGDGSPTRRAEVIARQAHLLEDEARQLASLAGYVLGPRRGGRQALEQVNKFAEEAEHFHQAYEKGADVEHVQRDFKSLDQAWRSVVSTLNNMPLQTNVYLRRKAARVNAVYTNLHRTLSLQSEQPTVQFFDR